MMVRDARRWLICDDGDIHGSGRVGGGSGGGGRGRYGTFSVCPLCLLFPKSTQRWLMICVLMNSNIPITLLACPYMHELCF